MMSDGVCDDKGEQSNRTMMIIVWTAILRNPRGLGTKAEEVTQQMSKLQD